MPQRDLHHACVVHALEKEGWTITDDPFRLEYGRRNLYVDLGAEDLLAAEKDRRRIAVVRTAPTSPTSATSPAPGRSRRT